MSNPLTIDLHGLADTERLGRALADSLFPDAVVSLNGQLGAGKTHLVRAVAEALEVPGWQVSSPTFGLIHEYQGRIPVFHFDVYRLNGCEDFLGLGVEEYWQAGGVCLIEWAEKVADCLPADRLEIGIGTADGERREVKMEATGPVHQTIVSRLSTFQ